jgi:hypothetical protein
MRACVRINKIDLGRHRTAPGYGDGRVVAKKHVLSYAAIMAAAIDRDTSRTFEYNNPLSSRLKRAYHERDAPAVRIG